MLPVADAGPDQENLNEGDEVFLDGSDSSDPGPVDTLTFSWTQTGGPLTVNLADAETATPSFNAPDNGTYTFQLVVNDGTDDSAPDTMDVTVENVAPEITGISAIPRLLDEIGGDTTITVTADDPAGVNDPLRYSFDCNGDDDFEVVPQASNSATCTFDENDPIVNIVNVKVEDGDLGIDTGDTTVVRGAAVDLSILPADDLVLEAEGEPSSGDLTLHFETNATPVDSINAVINVGSRVEATSVDELSVDGVVVNCSLDGVTITCTASGEFPETGDLATITVSSVTVGPAEVSFDQGLTTATDDGADVLRNADSAMVAVEGDVDLTLVVDIQGEEANGVFEVNLYDNVNDPFSTDDLSMPWVIFAADPDYTQTLPGVRDGQTFTIVLPDVPAGKDKSYDITIKIVRDDLDRKDTLANLRDDVTVDMDNMEPINMGTMREGNAVDSFTDPLTGEPNELSAIISALDASLLAAAIRDGTTDDLRVDFNQDGTSDEADLDLLKANYLLFSPVVLRD